ncbi:MAG: hypothetical protein R2882_03600 [Gemmatimonadales bacterium]
MVWTTRCSSPGLPVVDLAFTGPYGVHHSIYDNRYFWMTRFGDPLPLA